VVTREITVADAAPTIERLTATPERPAPGEKVVIRAHGVSARHDGVTRVEFFLDANRDGRIDAGDVNLGAGRRERPRIEAFDTGDIQFGDLGEIVSIRERRHIWRFDADKVTAGAAAGTTFTFLAQATDRAGAVSSASSPRAVTVTVR
jgi:hypothetical protein